MTSLPRFGSSDDHTIQIYDTDKELYYPEQASYNEEWATLTKKLTDENRVNLYYDPQRYLLVFRFEAVVRQKGRSARPQEYYIICQHHGANLTTLTKEISTELTNRIYSDNEWDKREKPNPQADPDLLNALGTHLSADNTSTGSEMSRVLSESAGYLKSGEKRLVLSASSVTEALEAVGYFKDVGASIVVGESINTNEFDVDLIIDYGQKGDTISPADKTSKKALKKYQKQHVDDKIQEYRETGISQISSVTNTLDSPSKKLKTLLLLDKALTSPNPIRNEHQLPEAGQQLAETARKARKDEIIGDAHQNIINDWQTELEAKIDSSRQRAVERAVSDVSETIDQNVSRLSESSNEPPDSLRREIVTQLVVADSSVHFYDFLPVNKKNLMILAVLIPFVILSIFVGLYYFPVVFGGEPLIPDALARVF